MKIIFFNINNVSIDKEGLIRYVNLHKSDTDIFCFQEVFDAANTLLTQLLPEYIKHYEYKYITDIDCFGQATFINSSCRFVENSEVLRDSPKIGAGQYSKLTYLGKTFHLINFHGLSRPVDKLESAERLAQTNGLIDFTLHMNEPVVIGGDFNLFNKTQSVELFSQNGYRDLIKEFNITNTRNEVVWRQFPDTKQYYSDYVFIKCDIKNVDLKVPYNEISDHLPLELSFDF